MRLVLHAGMWKTGSSTLQRTFTRHKDLLLDAGVLYPTPHEKYPNHNNLVWKLLPPEMLPHRFRPGAPKRSGRSDPMEESNTSWEKIADDVARVEAAVTILSGEFFFNLSRDGNVLRRFRDLLDGIFDDIGVVVYVRYPSSLYLSGQQQTVKFSHRRIRRPCDYRPSLRPRLETFMDAFDGRVLVRPYDREQLIANDIVHDFLSSTVPDASHVLDSMVITNENESMSAEAMCIAQKLRRHVFPDREDLYSPEAVFIREEIRMLETEDGVEQTRPALRPEISAMIADLHRPDLDWLQDELGVRFLAREREVDPPDQEPPGWRSRELTKILAVEPERVEAALYHLLTRLAQRAGKDQEPAAVESMDEEDTDEGVELSGSP